jgi:hypothetical protein
MKIRSIIATPVNIPLVAPIVWPVGLCPTALRILKPSQTLFRWQTDDVIHEGPFQPRNNTVTHPYIVVAGLE